MNVHLLYKYCAVKLRLRRINNFEEGIDLRTKKKNDYKGMQ